MDFFGNHDSGVRTMFGVHIVNLDPQRISNGKFQIIIFDREGGILIEIIIDAIVRQGSFDFFNRINIKKLLRRFSKEVIDKPRIG